MNELDAEAVVRVLTGGPARVTDVLEQRLVPPAPGLYAWWVDRGALVDVPGAPHPIAPDLDLLYVGISPSSRASSQDLRGRILGNHLRGNIGASTFRFTLASLLVEELGLLPIRTQTRVALSKKDNDRLSSWQREHLHLTWCVRDDPWEIEDEVIAVLAPPLNLASNQGHPFHETVSAARSRLRSLALTTSGVAVASVDPSQPAPSLTGEPSAGSEYWQPSANCWVCGRSTEESNDFLCARCKKVLGSKTISAEQKLARLTHMREQWARFGSFRCHYTHVELDLEDPTSVRYREWDHATPGDESSFVLSTALVNRMKCYLNVEEFTTMVTELARHFRDPSTTFDVAAFPVRAVPPGEA